MRAPAWWHALRAAVRQARESWAMHRAAEGVMARMLATDAQRDAAVERVSSRMRRDLGLTFRGRYHSADGGGGDAERLVVEGRQYPTVDTILGEYGARCLAAELDARLLGIVAQGKAPEVVHHANGDVEVRVTDLVEYDDALREAWIANPTRCAELGFAVPVPQDDDNNEGQQ